MFADEYGDGDIVKRTNSMAQSPTSEYGSRSAGLSYLSPEVGMS